VNRIWCKPTLSPVTNLISRNDFQSLIGNKNEHLMIFDFRSNEQREVYGYIQGSILVPNSLTQINVDDPSQSIAKELFFDEEEDKDKHVIFVTSKEEIGEAYQKLVALGYLEQNNSIKGYIEGIDAWVAAGGDIEFPRIINFSSLQKSLSLDATLLIDVRNRSELNFPGQIPSSVCVPLHEILNGAFHLSEMDFKERYGFEKPTESDVFVLTCRSGRRILVAEKYLKSLGYNHIRIYPGSYKDWIAHGGMTTRAQFSLDYDPL
jgi:rhodanese-related sulfurtransferase